MTDTPEHAVIFTHVLSFAALTRETEITKAVAVLTHTMLTHLTASVVHRAVGAGVAGGTVTLLGGPIADTFATALLAVDFVFRTHFNHTAVVAFVL